MQVLWEKIQTVKESLTLAENKAEVCRYCYTHSETLAFQHIHLLKGPSLIIATYYVVCFSLLNTGLHRLVDTIMPALNNVDFHTCKGKIILFSACLFQK